MHKPIRLVPLALVGAALVAAGCGGSDDSSVSADTTAKTAPAKTAPAVAPAAENAPKVSGATDLAHKPKVAKPTGDAPAFLVSRDLVVGKGPAAQDGDTVTVQYVGVSWSTGKEFDASWDAGQPFSFALGQSQVIPGWDQGVVGMRVGGRRELVIPPSLGYGDQGSPPAILPGETLVFVVDLKKIG
ncbi:MAG TPA: FKBP-type peptidyl-prolyl cis-trans isomerase [Solirubrobacteraceae bacterium]|jgi:peptidylprolyl isomerase|nr:FKBP-type peptidyl-prolyl cis-trans isomerase [Solirubrobacteraceae bacterium]